jgi:hypothetical protein
MNDLSCRQAEPTEEKTSKTSVKAAGLSSRPPLTGYRLRKNNGQKFDHSSFLTI